MDLFGRKARTELSVTQAMLAEKDSYLNGAAILLAERDKELKSLRAKLFVQTIKADLAQTKLDAELEKHRPRQRMSAQSLYMSEDEEDLKYQHDNNLIDTHTYEQMLKELEFENAEVSLAVEDLPESFHY